MSPNQCNFVSNRQSRDNIIITQEVIHYMERKKRRERLDGVKIDLEKMYDRLSWDFTKNTQEVGFPSNFIDVVFYCV